jgi:hypothetical protein
MTREGSARFETIIHLDGRDLFARYDGVGWELSMAGSMRTGRSLLALLEDALGQDPGALRAAIDVILVAMDSDLPSMRDPTWNAPG